MRKHACASGLTMLLLIWATGTAAAQTLAWATQAGGTDIDEGRAVAVDNLGNSYVTGIFSKSVTTGVGVGAIFGAGEPNETMLTSVSGSQDIFVAKYDANGALVWARGAGGGDVDQAWGIAVDADGNSYVSGNLGRFTSTADFGNGVALSPNGNGDWSFVIVVKYDPDGNAVWATNLGPGGTGFAIAVDPSGNTYVTGGAPDPVLGGEIVTTWMLNANGTMQWMKQATGVYSGRGTGIAADASGNIYVTGTITSGTATFGSGEPNETTLTDSNGSSGEMFLARYDGSGLLMWATQSEDVSGQYAYGNGLSMDGSGNVYVVGQGNTTLGSGEPNATIVSEVYIAKYIPSGALSWARSILGNGSAVGAAAVATDLSGNAILTGSFTTTVTFASGEVNETTLTSLGGFRGGDIYVADYDPDGNFAWVRQAGGDATTGGLVEMGEGISVDGTGSAYVTGVFSGSTIFGPGETNETTLTSSATSDWDVFVAKYQNDSATPEVADLDITHFRTTNRVALSHIKPVEISLTVRNNGTVDLMVDATVVGMQGGVEVYRETMSVFDNVGNGQTVFDFPSFTPTSAGDITWTVTFTDPNPDVDEATASTRVAS